MASDPHDREILDGFSKVTVWKRGGERAPHKPLLILYALARLQRGEPRLVPFEMIEEDVGRLLGEFGPPRATRPEYPFWHLQSDGLWEIPERPALQADIDAASHRHNPRVTTIRSAKARGGFTSELQGHLEKRPGLVNVIANEVLEANFPPTLHEDILDAVGMPWITATKKPRRDPAFRETILRIYEHRCAVCGYDGMLGNADLGIEAAHVRWHAAGGSDSEDNGLALCSFHHKVLDRGAIGLDDQRRVMISADVRGTVCVDELLLRHMGMPLRTPQTGQPPPSEQNVLWHRNEVFHGPARLVIES